MMTLEVTLDTATFDAVLKAVSRPALDKPVALALADTQKNTKVKAASAIARHMGSKSGGVKEAIGTPFVKEGDYQASITASKKPIPLIDFEVRQTAKGVATRAWGKPQVIGHAFIATMRTGHRGVYRRTGEHRLPIKELWGPTILGTFVTPEVAQVIRETMRKRLAYNLARRVRGALRKAAKKS